VLYGCCAAKRADEIIFDAQSGQASRVKKSDVDDAAAAAGADETRRASVDDDISRGSDEKKPSESELNNAEPASASVAAADDNVHQTQSAPEQPGESSSRPRAAINCMFTRILS